MTCGSSACGSASLHRRTLLEHVSACVTSSRHFQLTEFAWIDGLRN